MARSPAQLAAVLCCLRLVASRPTAWGADAVAAIQGTAHVRRGGGDACAAAEVAVEEDAIDRAWWAAKVELVVVRGSGEDVRWLDALPEVSALVYNRNGLPELLPKSRNNLRIQEQQNTGREDDAILRHIISNYDRLPEVTMFVQGWPFWHCADLLNVVRRAVKEVHQPSVDFSVNGAMPGLVPLASSFYEYSVPDGYVGSFWNLVQGDKKINNQKWDQAAEVATSSFNQTCRDVLDGDCPQKLWVSEGSQWAVSRDRILSRPKSFYQRLLEHPAGRRDLFRGRLRGLVLEALWPVLWGAPDWTPGDATKEARPGKFTSALRRTDALRNYCVFSTDKGKKATRSELLSLCDLERRAKNAPGEADEELHLHQSASNEPWSMLADLRPIMFYEVPKGVVRLQAGEGGEPEVPPLFCAKRHIWPPALITRVQNTATGKCIMHASSSLTVSHCSDEAEGQLWELISGQNGGSYQIQDRSSTGCIDHDLASSTSRTCKTGPDGGAVDTQKWELVQFLSGDGLYQVKGTGTDKCLAATPDGLLSEPCSDNMPASQLWHLSDARDMGQYYDKFDFSIVERAEGKLKLRCTMHLHSDRAEADLDLVEPEWKTRGRLVHWNITDAAAVGAPGSYLLVQQTRTGSQKYLACDRTTGEAQLSEVEVPWQIRSLSDGFVYLESDHGVLQFITEGGHLQCQPRSSGLPLKDSAFAIDFHY